MRILSHMWKLATVHPQERSTWRSGVRSVMCACSQLPRRGPLMWRMPLHLHVNQKSDYNDMKAHLHAADIFW